MTGEVEEVFVSLGDVVQEGALLCKINDDAAQLQMQSASASYESAEAGVKQAQGGSQSLQDLQMESGIEQLQKQINTINSSINDNNSKVNDLKKKLDSANQLVAAQKTIYETIAKKYNVAKSLQPVAEAIVAQGGTSITQKADNIVNSNGYSGNITIELAKNFLTNSGNATEPEIEIVKAYITMIESGLNDSDLNDISINTLSNDMSAAQANYQSALSTVSTIQQGISSYEGANEQAKSSKDTLEDNLNTSKKTQEITNNQVKVESNQALQSQLNAASIGIDSAKMQLDMYQITAPMSGVVDSINVTKNGFASSGNVAFILSNKESMTVTFYVSEIIQNTLQLGQSIEVERNGSIYSGSIIEVGQMVDQQVGLFCIKANVNATGEQLLSGTTVKIKVDTHQEQDVFVVPYDAVYYTNGIAYVYVAQEGVAVKKEVETGIFNQESIAIRNGLKAGDTMITTWSSNLKDGVNIQIK